MKIYNSKGSKERFIEVMERVNKIKINESVFDADESKNILDSSFNKLMTEELTIKQTNTNVSGDKSFVELICVDENNNEIIFNFEAQTAEGDQDGVFNLTNVETKMFSFESADGTKTINVDENGLKDFNQQHQNKLIDIVSKHIDVKKEEPVEDGIYEEAIKLIDKVPYRLGTQNMQTHKAYADEKPTNPDLRVNSDELDSYLSEIYDEDDDDIIGQEINRFNSMDFDDDDSEDEEPIEVDDEPEEEISDEKKELIWRAYNNVIEKSGRPNYAPTTNELQAEIKLLTGGTSKPEKTRTLSPLAANYLGEDVGSPDAAISGYYKTLTPEQKHKYIQEAKKHFDDFIRRNNVKIGDEGYKLAIKQLAQIIFEKNIAKMNEDSKFPEPLGKDFSTSSPFPEKKKTRQKKVKIKENEVDAVIDTKTGTNLSIGDVVTVDGLSGEYQVGMKFSEGRPFLMAFSMNSKRANPYHRIYISALNNPKLTKILDYSDTDGGFMGENINEDETEDVLLGFKPVNVGQRISEDDLFKTLGDILRPETPKDSSYRDFGYEEYQGDIGDRYVDDEGNEFVVREKVKGGVVLKSLSGEIEVATNDLDSMKRVNEMHKGNYNKDTIHKMHSGNFDDKLIDEFDSRELDMEKNDPEAWKKLQAQKKTQIVNEPPQLGVIAHKGRGGEELKKYSIDEDDMTIDETEGENSVRKNYVMLNRRPDFQKLSDSYRELLKLNSNFRNNSEFQNVLSSLRDAIAKYFNENNVSVTPEDVQNYYTNWSKRKKYQSADAIMEYKPKKLGDENDMV